MAAAIGVLVRVKVLLWLHNVALWCPWRNRPLRNYLLRQSFVESRSCESTCVAHSVLILFIFYRARELLLVQREVRLIQSQNALLLRRSLVLCLIEIIGLLAVQILCRHLVLPTIERHFESIINYISFKNIQS